MQTDINFLKERFKTLAGPLRPVSTETQPKLRKLEGIRFMIFDFYGTLFISGVGDIGIDEESQDIRAFQQALESCGLSSDEKTAEAGFIFYDQKVEEHCQRLIDDGFETPEPVIELVWLDVLQSLRDNGYIDRQPDLALARWFAVEFEVRMNPVWPVPHLNKTLDAISGGSFELGIISNSQFYTPVAFEALAGRSLIEMGFNPSLLHWSFEENLKKPSLVFYEGFLEKLQGHFPGAAPESVLYTGNDMLKDIYPASALGIKTALFAGDERSLKWRSDDERCRNLEPDLVVTSLQQLIECI
jgi:putative hydrolase of the HAD superfamily